MPEPDLEYILGYGSSGWLWGHLRAREIGNVSCGGAVRHRCQPRSPLSGRLRRDVTPAAGFLYPLNTMHYC